MHFSFVPLRKMYAVPFHQGAAPAPILITTRKIAANYRADKSANCIVCGPLVRGGCNWPPHRVRAPQIYWITHLAGRWFMGGGSRTPAIASASAPRAHLAFQLLPRRAWNHHVAAKLFSTLAHTEKDVNYGNKLGCKLSGDAAKDLWDVRAGVGNFRGLCWRRIGFWLTYSWISRSWF